MGIVIAVTSGKGWTGKTSVTGGSPPVWPGWVSGCCASIWTSACGIWTSPLGLSDRALMDFSDVAEGRCPLARAAVTHPDLPNLSPADRPHVPVPDVTAARIRALLRTARDRYDYIMIDSPPDLAPGFQLAVCGADRALVVATNDASPCGTPSGRWRSCTGSVRSIWS